MTSRQAATQPVVAAFDFDGTITTRDSLLPFLHFSASGARFIGQLVRLIPVLALYTVGMVGRQAAKEAVITRFFGGMEKSRLAELGSIYARQGLPRLLRPKAMARLRWHRQQGHYCILISASPDVYLEPWGKEMGFDAVICSRLEYDSANCITGKLAGDNCWGPEKVRRLRQLVGQPFELYAYGDSRGDRELLGIANHAYYRCMPDSGES